MATPATTIRGAFIEPHEALLIEDEGNYIGEVTHGGMMNSGEAATFMCQNYTETRAWRFNTKEPHKSEEITELLVTQWISENAETIEDYEFDGSGVIPAFVLNSPQWDVSEGDGCYVDPNAEHRLAASQLLERRT